MGSWTLYTAEVDEHTVTGDLRVYHDLYSPQLDNRRDVLAWLPESYGRGDRRYPVLYMHDGQNLFDAQTSYAGEWRVDETMIELGREGCEAIVVGLPHQGDLRMVEYSPFPAAGPEWPDGRGDAYLDFILETVKPLIDASFRTLPGPEATGIAGSSMGGLISLYGFLVHQDRFGLCGAFSTAVFPGDDSLLQTIEARAAGRGRIYLDVGTHEGEVLAGDVPSSTSSIADLDEIYAEGVRALRDGLVAHGYRLGDSLLYVEEAGAIHHEEAWARRLPAALRFLLGC
jgi:predicted alpha/beta superfamily hydrolase